MQTVTNDIITNYQTAIYKIASKVAGSRKDIIEDLTQEGLILFCQLYPKNSKWSFLSRAIKNRLLDTKAILITPVYIDPTFQRQKQLILIALEIDHKMPEQESSIKPLAESLLQRLEADIKQLPAKESIWAEKALATLAERNPKHPPSKKGMAIINRLKAKYLAEYLSLTQK